MKKPKRDVNQAAFDVVNRATEDKAEKPKDGKPEKDPAAVALGRKGGLKGGKARAAKLSKKCRSEIASRAAQARWKP